MNTYHAFFMGRTIELEAKDLWSARKRALEILRPKKSQEGYVAIVLVAVNGKPVEHDGASI